LEQKYLDLKSQGRFGLWCLMPLLTIFQLYCGCQFYWWRKPGNETGTTIFLDLKSKWYRNKKYVWIYSEKLYIYQCHSCYCLKKTLA